MTFNVTQILSLKSIDIELLPLLPLLTYDCVPLGHGVSQLASHPEVCQFGVTLHVEQNVASLVAKGN